MSWTGSSSASIRAWRKKNFVLFTSGWGFSLSYCGTGRRHARPAAPGGRAATPHTGGAMNRTSFVAGSLFALFAVSASATDHTVIARPDRTFDPPTLSIAVGDTVTFMNDPDAPGFHN